MNSMQLSFKANAGLKDIIGRGLILDDNIAILELIKNSKDAQSKKVRLEFVSDIANSHNDEIIISDYGKGMNISDIQGKWLNIAYSEKKQTSIKKKKKYAGNKGVGRFSCDRLGASLVLYTKSQDGDFIKLPIDWTLFEIDDEEAEISTIPLDYTILSEEEFLSELGVDQFETGTVLKVQNLRSEWNNQKIKKLKAELEKFVFSPGSEFEVYLKAWLDPEIQITNKVFEELSFRTYNIRSEIDPAGDEIHTTLFYRNEPIYRYSAENPYESLKNISVNIHYLNMPSKSYFKKKTGYSSNTYGSVFLFLNGFRVSPLGNNKNDWLNLDQRKSQGTARYFGTRDVLGQINIDDDDNTFLTVSSREGLVQNEAYYDLVSSDKDRQTTLKSGKKDYGFVTQVIRQLERFVVEGLSWHGLVSVDGSQTVVSEKSLRENPLGYKLKPVNEANIKDVIDKTIRTANFKVTKFEINEKLIARLSHESEDAYNEFILNFIQNTTNKSFENLNSQDKQSLKKIAAENMRAINAEKTALEKVETERVAKETAEAKAEEERIAKEAAEKNAKEERKAKEAAEAKAEEERIAKEAAEKREKEEKAKHNKTKEDLREANDENIFRQMDSSKSLDHILNLHHQIVLYSSTIGGEIENLKFELDDNEFIATETIKEYLASIEVDINKILKVSSFATNQKYKLAIEEVRGNLVEFVSNYLTELDDQVLKSRRINIHNNLDLSITYQTDYSPLNIMILVDNLISNAGRAFAKNISFNPPTSPNGLFTITDDGRGLDKKVDDPKKIFNKGFTTTKGSGRGLYHVKDTLSDLGLNIEVVISDTPPSSGLSFEVIENAN